jgi:hypothetical protein
LIYGSLHINDTPDTFKPVQTSHSSSNLNQRIEWPFDSIDLSIQVPMNTHDPRLNGDATVIFRTVLNLDDYQRWNQFPLTHTRPQPTIVEHQGKQFVSEYRERLERRSVQVFDESVGRMRYFEVTDYIPSRTVRPMQQFSQRRINPVILTARPAPNQTNVQHAGK